MNCDICGGAGVILVPVMYPYMDTDTLQSPLTWETTRAFECPQCQLISKKRTEVFSVAKGVNSPALLPRNALYAIVMSGIEASAVEIGRHLMRSGMMTIEALEGDYGFQTRVSLRVVMPKGMKKPEKMDLNEEAERILDDLDRKGVLRA